MALAFGAQTPPAGPRGAIVTNAGGPGILSTDACEASGLTVPEPSPELRARLTAILPGAASVGNPVDLIAAAGAGAYQKAVEALLTSGEYDSLLALYTPVGLAATADVEKAVADGVAAARKAGAEGRPVLACFLDQSAHRTHLECESERIPCFPFPETPARVLGKLAAYGSWRSLPPGVFPNFEDSQLPAARDVCRAAAARGEGWLSAEDVRKVLTAAGLPLVPDAFARTVDEAAEAAARLGFPVALKLASRRLVHKSDVGGVRLNLADATAVRAAFEEIRQSAERAGGAGAVDGVLVQPMVRGGVEVMAGVTQDPLFGPMVAFGLGGIHVEVLADVSFRVAPLTDRDASEMVRGIRGFRLLEGYRGHPPADLGALEQTLLRLSRLAEDVPEVAEIDLNPIFAFPPDRGCLVADARIRVRKAE